MMNPRDGIAGSSRIMSPSSRDGMAAWAERMNLTIRDGLWDGETRMMRPKDGAGFAKSMNPPDWLVG
ncbi:unnamed protein product [Allacma fusca]|uniref:Uncharacterized protein n=1 Tax=Allacma fusca TaxID=39272 RepID=A0A8J2PU47_9HEXA|nr:unnamed protein product [Allacma fusca]